MKLGFHVGNIKLVKVYTKFLSLSGSLVLGGDLKRLYWAYDGAFTNVMFKGGTSTSLQLFFPLDNLTSIGPVFGYYTHSTRSMSHNQRSTPACMAKARHTLAKYYSDRIHSATTNQGSIQPAFKSILVYLDGDVNNLIPSLRQFSLQILFQHCHIE